MAARHACVCSRVEQPYLQHDSAKQPPLPHQQLADLRHSHTGCATYGIALQMRIVSRLSYASTLEARQHSLLPAWQWPAWLMFITWLVVHAYSFIRYCYFGGTSWVNIILYVSDAVPGRHGLGGPAMLLCQGCVNGPDCSWLMSEGPK